MPSRPGTRRVFSTHESIDSSFDYIVIGGGSSGSVVANRLSEDPNVTVLLVEAGPEGLGDPNVDTPIAWTNLLKSESDWHFTTEAQGKTKNRQHFWPRGKLLGGSSSINAMLYVRCNAADYDEWERDHGCAGWGFKKVQGYFTKSEGSQLPEDQVDADMHGTEGPLKVSTTSGGDVLPLNNVFIGACEQLGVGRGADGGISGVPVAYEHPFYGVDYNGKTQFGAGISQSTIYKGVRWSTNRAYIQPLVDPDSPHYRNNLTVLVDHYATKLVFADDGKAQPDGHKKVTGVHVQKSRESSPCMISAAKEVIVSCGAVNSPGLLMVSGIGPAAELAKHNIPVVADLPVGENLHDHMIVPMCYNDKTSTMYRGTPPILATAMHKYKLYQGGMMATCGVESMAFFNSERKRTGRGGPDSQIHFMPACLDPPFLDSFGWDKTVSAPNPDLPVTTAFDASEADASRDAIAQRKPRSTFAAVATLLQPHSRGTVRLRSTDAFDKVAIDPRYFGDERDLDAMVDCCKGTRRIVDKMREMEPEWVGEEMVDESIVNELWRADTGKTGKPDAEERRRILASDGYLREMCRRMALTVYHPVGTCKMGPSSDPTTVVSSETLKVKGFSNLRVVDASIMPAVVSGNTNAPCVMIGEVASDIIKGRFSS
ncbi:GMC oxidoreductase-domain-containing protein [Zopfochytrium polystomum]|nr:GMC oxidoreductase-domain-containing protein [Zopfochytrium polystomum]